MAANVYPVNAVTGAPSYTGRMLRQLGVAPFVAMGTAARPLGAKSGIRPGTPSSIIAVTSTTWTVHPFAGVIDGESLAIAGPYTYSFDTDQTGAPGAAGGAARVDRLDVQLSDPAEGDGSSTPGIQIVYTQGAATGGAVPAAPSRSHKLCLFNVPASGGGSPTVSWMPDWMGAPGEWTFNTLAELTAYTTLIGSANVPPWQEALVIGDTTATNNGVYTWNSSAWVLGGVVTSTDANGWTVQTVAGKRTYVQTFPGWAGLAFGGFGGSNSTQQRSAISPPVGRSWSDFRVSVDVWPIGTALNSAQAVIQGYLTNMSGTGAGALIYYNPTAVTVGNTNMSLVGAVVLTEL